MTIIVSLLAVFVPIVCALSVSAWKHGWKELRCWQAYLDKRKDNKYITIPPSLLCKLFRLLDCEIEITTVKITDLVGYPLDVSYGLKMTFIIPVKLPEWVYTQGLPLGSLKMMERPQPVDVLVFGRNMHEQAEMNSAAKEYFTNRQREEIRRTELNNDVSLSVMKSVSADIERIIDENLRTAQEAAKENQEIMERLSGTSSTHGGTP